jgi:hypothetical protein
MKSKPKGAKYRNLTEPDLDEIEKLARADESETYRGALLALVGEVRRLREVALGGGIEPQRVCAIHRG